MRGRHNIVVIDVDRERLGLADSVVGEDSVTVNAWVSVARPESVSFDDADAMGRWVRQVMDRAEVRAGRAIMAMPRGDVVLKRLSLPAVGAPSEAEVGGMVRLQMVRQLTMPSESVAIDYTAPSPDTAASPNEAGSASVSVMAGAMPGERVEWCRKLCESADLTLDRVALKCYGAAGLLADMSQRRAGPVLGVCAGASSVEFVVVEEGQLAFARAIDAPRSQGDADAAGYAERVAVEAKRTWISHRSTRGGGDAEVVVALGADESARQLAQQCGAQIERPWELGKPPSTVELRADVPPGDAPALYALTGLLLEELGERRTLDFANPRRAPDPGAARRRHLLLAALGVILVAGGSIVAGKRSLDGYQERLDAARTRESELKSKLDEFHVQHARLNHLEQWQKARVNWLAYLGVLHEQLPETTQTRLDGLDGKLAEADVVYTAKGSRYLDGAWGIKPSVAFAMDGWAAGRSVSADLRGRFLDLAFDSVESKGPDVADRFQFVLTTSLPEPGKARPAEGTDGAGNQGGVKPGKAEPKPPASAKGGPS